MQWHKQWRRGGGAGGPGGGMVSAQYLRGARRGGIFCLDGGGMKTYISATGHKQWLNIPQTTTKLSPGALRESKQQEYLENPQFQANTSEAAS